MVRGSILLVMIAFLGGGSAPPPPILAGPASYADLVVLALGAPVVVRATIAKAARIAPDQAAGVAAGSARVLVKATLTTAILAPADVPAAIEYLADVPVDIRGKPLQLKGADTLVFLRGGAGGYALANARGQIGWSAATEAAVRRVIAEARRADPVITGVGNAFHVAGSVPGEAESQFFLTTADSKPVSLVVLSRPGEAKRLSVALGEVIDEAAGGVAKETLLWYRLACFLPRVLPGEASGDAALAADYAFVLQVLGPCGRTLP